MARRTIAAAVGAVVGLALWAPPAVASGAVTMLHLTLDAVEVPAGSNVTGSVQAWTGPQPWAPFVEAELTVSVDGVALGTIVTDADGVALFGYPMEVQGEHVLKVAFAGDETHRKAQRAHGFTVTEALPAPPAPPEGAPESPALVGEAPAPGLVYLEWTIPADGGSPITGYRVYRGNASGAETFLFAKPASAFSAVDVSVTAGTTYHYVVTAVNAVGESAWSNEVAVTAI